MTATKMFFRSGRLLGHLPVSHLKYNALDNFQEVFQTASTSRKSSGLLGSLLAKSSFHNRSERFDLEDFWDDLPVSYLKYNVLDNFQEVFQTTSTSRKSSGLLGSLLAKSSFHNRSERFGFSDLEDFWDDLPVSRLKYNALDDFQEVFQETTSWKSSNEVSLS
ncbi:hypothetical protein F2Q69_00061500 [Brassica cretica]|uniref:Uncharacterized protein n=1 Tax=Brassica cretica TaxID=69181 RepID=A0A8S9RDC9_BRACR|nr:hypothetical protein F2Q69_00061500 [Brassica cretica]